jgi:NTP pyrophosphatase (non-canonical NTP hydrolase)
VEDILQKVREERKWQNKKWGEQNHTPEKWLSILGEEFGEVCRAVYEKDIINYKEELVQLAAVAVQMLECQERLEHENN